MRARDLNVSGPAIHYKSTTLYTDSWALVVGINEYLSGDIPPLQYAEADADAVAQLLPEIGFPRENTVVLLGSVDSITGERLRQLLDDELNPRMKSTDRLLVYAAGHGVSSRVNGITRGHLLMPGSELLGQWPTPERPHLESRPKAAVEMELFLKGIQGLNPRHKLLLLDACYSGLAAPRAAAGPRKLSDRHISLQRLIDEPVTQVLTAGRSGQRSFESPKYGHGVFTYHLLRALEGSADDERCGVITFSQLASYVKTRVGREEEIQQNPQSSQDDGQGEFLLLVKSAVDEPGLVGLRTDAKDNRGRESSTQHPHEDLRSYVVRLATFNSHYGALAEVVSRLPENRGFSLTLKVVPAFNFFGGQRSSIVRPEVEAGQTSFVYLFNYGPGRLVFQHCPGFELRPFQVPAREPRQLPPGDDVVIRLDESGPEFFVCLATGKPLAFSDVGDWVADHQSRQWSQTDFRSEMFTLVDLLGRGEFGKWSWSIALASAGKGHD